MTGPGEQALGPRAYRAATAALPLLLLAVHWQWLVLGRPPFGVDAQVFFPILEQYRRWIAAGHLPLWSESIFSGQPIVLQSEPALLHPLRWPLLRFTGIHAEGWWLYLHGLLAGFGMLGYLRRIGCSRLAALIGAYAAALGGFFTVQLTHSHVVAGAAWIPVLLLLIERILEGSRPALWAALLALAAGMQWLAGHGQVPMLTAYYLGLYTALRAWLFYQDRRRSAPVVWTAAALVLGLLLASYQIVPLFETLGQTARTEGVSFTDSAYGSLPPWGLLLPLFPAFYGAEGPSQDAKFWLSSAGGKVGAWDFHFYAGALLALLALAGLRRIKGHAQGRTHLALFVFCLLFALGKYGPVYWFAWHLPGVHQTRVPARAMGLVFFSMISLGALAWDRLASEGAEGRAAWIRLTRCALLTVLGIWLLCALGVRAMEAPLRTRFEAAAVRAEEKRFESYHITDADSRAERLAHAHYRAEEVLAQLKRAFDPLSALGLTNLGFIALSGWLVALVLGAAGKKERSRWALVLLALLAADLLWFDARFGVRDPRDDPRSPPPFAEKVDRSKRVFSLMGRPDEEYRSWTLMKERLTPNMGAAWGLDSPDGDTSTGPTEFVTIHDDLRLGYLAGIERLRRAQRLAPRLAVLGVGYIVAQTAWGKMPWRAAYQDERVTLWEVPEPLPRAMLSSRDDLESEAWKAALGDPVPTEKTLALFSGLAASALGTTRRKPTATPDEVVFETNAPAAATLLRTTRNFPGWRAFVDGEEAPLETVVGFFQGVRVPAGKHEVRFSFEPPALARGIRISAVAGVFVLGMLLWGLFRRPD